MHSNVLRCFPPKAQSCSNIGQLLVFTFIYKCIFALYFTVMHSVLSVFCFYCRSIELKVSATTSSTQDGAEGLLETIADVEAEASTSL